MSGRTRGYTPATTLRRAFEKAFYLCVTVGASICLAACSPVVLAGKPASMSSDPERVAGLPATSGPTGVRSNAPPTVGNVEDTDSGDNDYVALLAVNDVEDFWLGAYHLTFPGQFRPVRNLLSYDSTSLFSPEVCGDETYRNPNAHYCRTDDSIAWDRGSLIPAARHYYTDVGVAGVLAHELGHAVQFKSGITDRSTPPLVAEQQADCFAGVYLRWVAEGHSPRFGMSTTDGLDHVLAGALILRDGPEIIDGPYSGHGSALDRIGAFQEGFQTGASACASIDKHEIDRRRNGLPITLQYDASGESQVGEMVINDESLATLMELLGQVFRPTDAPTLTIGGNASCPDARSTPPASYCPATNTINVDLSRLQELGTYREEHADLQPLQGDDTAFSMVTSRYMLAVQQQRGLTLNGQKAALRTACLTGAAQAQMADTVVLPSGKSIVLAAGDLDEAISGILINHLVASDVNGDTAPAGFTRISAFRSGLLGDADQCYTRFT